MLRRPALLLPVSSPGVEGRLKVDLGALRDVHGACYGSAVQATLARFSAHPALMLCRSVE